MLSRTSTGASLSSASPRPLTKQTDPAECVQSVLLHDFLHNFFRDCLH